MSMFETDREITIHGLTHGREPIQLLYGKARFDPKKIGLRFTQKPGQPWRLTHVVVGGESIRKDGSIGGREHENSYSTSWIDPTQWSGDAPPEWLRAIAREQEQRLNRDMAVAS